MKTIGCCGKREGRKGGQQQAQKVSQGVKRTSLSTLFGQLAGIQILEFFFCSLH